MAANLLVREILSTRRVFLPTGASASIEQLSDLALRLEAIGHNRQVSAVLIAPHYNNDDVDDVDNENENNSVNLPLIATSRLIRNVTKVVEDDVLDSKNSLFFNGYNLADDNSFMEKVQALQNLVRIVHSMSPAPAVCVPHGKVCDGGYAVCIGRYTLATERSSFQVLHPTRGLTLDGGLSFVLPRLAFGLSINKGNDLPVDKVLALTGYEANCYDMVASGLASHFMNWGKAVMLEHELSEMNPFADRTEVDIVLDEMMDSYSSGSTHKHDMFGEELPYWEIKNTENGKTLRTVPPFRMGEDHGSRLMDVAFAFRDAFNEKSIVGVVERLKEIEGQESDDETVRYAKTFVKNIEARSPLALHATFRLLNEGRKPQKLVDCLHREEKAQLRLSKVQDFESWNKGNKNWKHSSLSDVTEDEVDALFQE